MYMTLSGIACERLWAAATLMISTICPGRVVTEYGTGWGPGYVYLGGELLAEYSNGTTYFAHADHLGSARLLTNMSEGTAENMDYLPFGDQIAGASLTTHKFTGDERDSESNLDHTLFRQYSSSLGRWMHPDPAGLAAVDPTNPQSWNRYAYVANNPIFYVDPSGLGQCAPAIVGVGCGGGGGGGGNCTMDGIDTPCSLAGASVNSGAAAICPNNNCTGIIGVNQNNQFIGSIYNLNGYLSRSCAGTFSDVTAYGCGSFTWHPQGFDGFGPVGQVDPLDQVGNDLWHPGPQCPTCGHSFTNATGFVNVATAVVAVGAAPVLGIEGAAALGPDGPIFGTRFMGNNPLFNARDELRIGWSYIRSTGEYVFRIGGDWLKPFMDNPHINIWPPRWWGGPPGP